jgi:soluble lytic murein transglycosylase
MTVRRKAASWAGRAAALCFALAVVAGACTARTAPAPPTAPADPTAATAVTATVPAATGPTPTPVLANPTLAGAREALQEGRFSVASDVRSAAAWYAAAASLKVEALTGAGIARYEDGDRDGAIAALRAAVAASDGESTQARRARFLLGLRLNEAGQATEAVAALRPLISAPRNDALQPYVALEYGRSAAASGDSGAARQTWETILTAPGTAPALRIEIHRARASAARAAGDQPALAGALRDLLSLTSDPAARYELASISARAGDMATFAASLRSLIAESPGAREAVLSVADLRDAGYAVDAGQEGLVYYRHGAYREAKSTLTRAVDEPGIAASERAFRSYYLGAANEDSGNAKAAIEAYDAVTTIDPGGRYVHKARYWAAHVVESTGESAGASARYLALATAGPAGEFSAEAAFRSGYVLLRAGDGAGALAVWARVGAARDSRLRYWQGRAFDDTGDATRARESYSQAAALDPLSFYAGEARRRLGTEGSIDVSYRPLPAITAPDWDELDRWLTRIAGSNSGQLPSTGAAELMALGLQSLARAALWRAAEGEGAWGLSRLAREAYEAGLLDVSAQLAVRLRQQAGVEYADAPPTLLRLAYPLGFPAALDREAKANGLDPLFLAALVRQESFWDPGAISPADAYGLTQVIPSTGESLARALGMTSFKPGDLLRPAVSLRFGAYYLAGQLRRFGAPFVALAAYNAGPGNAARWAASGPAQAADFAATIDFLETQHYVELVLDHLAHYQAAYAAASR